MLVLSFGPVKLFFFFLSSMAHAWLLLLLLPIWYDEAKHSY